jgi:hypothetical protein
MTVREGYCARERSLLLPLEERVKRHLPEIGTLQIELPISQKSIWRSQPGAELGKRVGMGKLATT